MKKNRLIMALCAPTPVFATATQQPPVPNSYTGVIITPETLYNIMPHMPGPDRVALDAWLKTPETQALILKLLSPAHFPDWNSKMVADNAALIAAGMPSTSELNYVFNIPNQDFVIKIDGPGNRVPSILAANGILPGQKPDKPITKVDTYQTASRAAYYLILKELIEKHRFKHINVPETYLFYFADTTQTIDDEHAFVVQKAIPASAQQITPALAQALPDEAISELVQAIIGAGLWDITTTLFLDNETHNGRTTVQLVDIEQPNTSIPATFFYKDATQYYQNIRIGLEAFINLFAGKNEKLTLIRTLIETNPVFNSPNFTQQYKDELIHVLHAKAPHPQCTPRKENK